ncbi:DNA-binding protein [Sabulicella rubraurantiaca]|uniref:DNA-binding protein n=1 Tax=Sabulicella rubraurantiaca TaxID=2811429 RepID=UPI001A974E21|nr:DNA-binding protein [Sabulicella rubraurantiaca]
MSVIPDHPDTLLTRDACAAALTAAGYPTASATLATKATRGGGPPFHRFGPRALYNWGAALAWAKAKLTPARRSTSEADAARAA